MGLFVQLDVNWPDDDAVIEAGLEAAAIHAFIMCLAKRTETDGWVSRRLLGRYGATPEHLARLVALGLVEDGGERVRSAGWLKRNPSQGAIEVRRAAKAESGRKGNHKRWHDGEYDDCHICHPERFAQVVAGSDRTVSQPASGPIATVSPYTYTESVTGTDRTSSQDATDAASDAEAMGRAAQSLRAVRETHATGADAVASVAVAQTEGGAA